MQPYIQTVKLHHQSSHLPSLWQDAFSFLKEFDSYKNYVTKKTQ